MIIYDYQSNKKTVVQVFNCTTVFYSLDSFESAVSSVTITRQDVEFSLAMDAVINAFPIFLATSLPLVLMETTVGESEVNTGISVVLLGFNV